MSNFTNLVALFKVRFSEYIEEICRGFSTPEKKLVRDLAWGILRSGKALVSDIARSLNESHTLDSVEIRLTLGMKRFYYPKLVDSIVERISKIVASPIKICVDESDINKEDSRKLEGLCLVRDGSQPGDVLVNGYHVTGLSIVGGNENFVFPFCMDIYSTLTKGYTSIYDQTTSKLAYPLSVLEGREIASLVNYDRGYDDSKYVNFCDEMGVLFVIRAKETRKYNVGDQRLTIHEIGAKYKGKYVFRFLDKEGNQKTVSAGAVKAYHPDFGEIYIVFEKHSKTDIRYYLTNIPQKNKDDCARALKTYRIRWRIEELFRFIKQGFRFEYMLVRNLNSMNTMAAVILLVVNFMTELMMEKNALYHGILKAWPQFRSAQIRKQKRREFGRYGFEYYAFQQGILEILKHAYLPPEIKKRNRKKEPIQMSIDDFLYENQVAKH